VTKTPSSSYSQSLLLADLKESQKIIKELAHF
jgi:hypothetical protein